MQRLLYIDKNVEEEEEDAVSFGHGDVWEGGECSCSPVQPLKDADLFLRGPLPDLVLSGGGMVTSQLKPSGLPRLLAIA